MHTHRRFPCLSRLAKLTLPWASSTTVWNVPVHTCPFSTTSAVDVFFFLCCKLCVLFWYFLWFKLCDYTLCLWYCYTFLCIQSFLLWFPFMLIFSFYDNKRWRNNILIYKGLVWELVMKIYIYKDSAGKYLVYK